MNPTLKTPSSAFHRRRLWYALAGAAVLVALVLFAVSQSRTPAEGLTEVERHVLESLAPYGGSHELDADGHVVRLILHGKQVTDEALAEVHTLPRLKRLSLHNSSVTDQGLIAVAKCKRLENLGLTETQVTNAGLAHLHQLASLQNVWVTLGDRLTTRGASDLRRALPTTMVHIQQKGGNPKGKQQE